MTKQYLATIEGWGREEYQMIKYTTTHNNGRFGVKQIKWTPETHYNHPDIYGSYEAALEFVQDINGLVQQVIKKRR